MELHNRKWAAEMLAVPYDTTPARAAVAHRKRLQQGFVFSSDDDVLHDFIDNLYDAKMVMRYPASLQIVGMARTLTASKDLKYIKSCIIVCTASEKMAKRKNHEFERVMLWLTLRYMEKIKRKIIARDLLFASMWAGMGASVLLADQRYNDCRMVIFAWLVICLGITTVLGNSIKKESEKMCESLRCLKFFTGWQRYKETGR